MKRYPSQFDEIQNQIIECHRQGLPPPEELEILQEWLMADGWDHALAAWDDEAVVLNLAELAKDCFTDQCASLLKKINKSLPILSFLRSILIIADVFPLDGHHLRSVTHLAKQTR
jgi:hypothetical protein